MAEEVGVRNAAALVEAIRAALAARRFSYTSEAELQAAIGNALNDELIANVPEHKLRAADRIDFFIPWSIANPSESRGVGIEVKIAGSPSELLRQLMRYAECPQIEALIVFTDKLRLARAIPETLNAKRITVICCAEAAL